MSTEHVPDLPEWRLAALCRGKDKLFLPRGLPGGGTTPGLAEKIARAKAICGECPVALDCLEYALTCGGQGGPAKDGVWAGRTPEELQALARARRLAKSR